MCLKEGEIVFGNQLFDFDGDGKFEFDEFMLMSDMISNQMKDDDEASSFEFNNEDDDSDW